MKHKGIAGLSAGVLERTRTFYLFNPQIGEKIPATLSRKLTLSSMRRGLDYGDSHARATKPVRQRSKPVVA